MSTYVEFIKPSYSAVKSVNGKIGAVVLTAEDLDLEGMATEEYVAQKIAEAQLNESEVDLSAYYTKSETNAQIKQAIDAIPETDLSDYATKAYVSDAIPSLEGYATEDYVTQKVNEAAIGGEVDLTGYAKTTDIPTKVSQLENDKGYLTEHQSLADYAKKSEIPSLEGYAKTSDIPDVSGYALKSEIPDVSGYTTMSAVEAKGYQTADQVTAAINSALSAFGNAEEGAY